MDPGAVGLLSALPNKWIQQMALGASPSPPFQNLGFGLLPSDVLELGFRDPGSVGFHDELA